MPRESFKYVFMKMRVPPKLSLLLASYLPRVLGQRQPQANPTNRSLFSAPPPHPNLHSPHLPITTPGASPCRPHPSSIFCPSQSKLALQKGDDQIFHTQTDGTQLELHIKVNFYLFIVF